MKIAQYLTDEQRAAILAHDYHLSGEFLVTKDDGLNRCPLAVAADKRWTPLAIQLARMLDIPLDAVQEFCRAADHGVITTRAALARAIGGEA